MRTITPNALRLGSAFAAAVVVLGLVNDAKAYQQRRGRTIIPQRPVNVDSSPMVDVLKKALRALGETDRDYDGHREKAIHHIGLAIQDLQVPTAKKQTREPAADTKTDASQTTAKTPTTPQDASDTSLRKARTALYDAHHKLTDKSSTAGRIHADAEVRIAIDELNKALGIGTPAAAPARATAPAAAPAPAPARAPARGTPGR
jgi:hypothetical protein